MKGTKMFDAIAHIDEDLVDRCLKADAVRAENPVLNSEAEPYAEQAQPNRRKTVLSIAGLAAAVVGAIALISVLHIGGVSHKNDNSELEGNSKVTESPEVTPAAGYVLETPSPENAKFIGAWAGTDCNQALHLKEDGSFDIFTEGSDGKYVYAESGAFYLRGDVLGLYSPESGEYMESTVVYEADGQHLTMTNETGTMHFERVDFEQLWAPTEAPTEEPTPDPHEGYDAEDVAVMREFLEMKDEFGVKNGKKLFPNYDPNDPETWYDGSYNHDNAVHFDESGRVRGINLKGTGETALRLIGGLDLSAFKYLENFRAYNVELDGLCAEDLPSASEGLDGDIRADMVWGEAWFSGGYIDRISLLSARRVLCELTGEADTILAGDLPSVKIEVSTEGRGFAGVKAYSDENYYEVKLHAEPFAAGVSFLGWYDADGKLVSTEPVYELFGEKSGKHCEGAHAEFAFTARFSGTIPPYDNTWAFVLDKLRVYTESTAEALGLEFDYDNAEFTQYQDDEAKYMVRIPEKGGGALFVDGVKLTGNDVELPKSADLMPDEASGHSSDYEAGESFRSTVITVTPQEIAAYGCTATEGKAYMEAAYNVFAAKLAEMYLNAEEDCPARCISAEVASVSETEYYEEYDIRISVVPADPYAFFNYCDGLVSIPLQGEHAFRMMAFSQCRLTKNSDGSFSSPAFSYWGV